MAQTVKLSPRRCRKGSSRYEDEANCEICGEGDWEEDNVILFCDGCNIAVHQVCYGGGARKVPEGSWFCDKCLQNQKSKCKDVDCVLCPSKNGALKRTTDCRWTHVVCALWVPEVKFLDAENRDYVHLFGVNEKRCDLRCVICGENHGACIQCKERRCLTAFHVTCAHKAGLHMEAKEKDDWVDFTAYCDKHTPCQGPKKKRRRRQERW